MAQFVLCAPIEAAERLCCNSPARGNSLAEASLFSTYHCDAIATAETVVRLYPKSVLLDELQRDPNTAKLFAAMLVRQVMTLRTHLERRNIHSAHGCIRHFFTVNVSADGRTVVLPRTLKDLAADLRLAHGTLYRALARMEVAGEITRTGNTISVEPAA
ncbi:MAG: hypothetical protein ABI351_00960 [Herbaspirillum sp.]